MDLPISDQVGKILCSLCNIDDSDFEGLALHHIKMARYHLQAAIIHQKDGEDKPVNVPTALCRLWSESNNN